MNSYVESGLSTVPKTVIPMILNPTVSAGRVHEYLRSLPLETLIDELYSNRLISRSSEDWKSAVIGEAQESLAKLMNARNRPSEAFLLRNVSPSDYFKGLKRIANEFGRMMRSKELDGREKIATAKRLHAELIAYATSDVVFDEAFAGTAEKYFNNLNKTISGYITKRKFQAYKPRNEVALS